MHNQIFSLIRFSDGAVTYFQALPIQGKVRYKKKMGCLASSFTVSCVYVGK